MLQELTPGIWVRPAHLSFMGLHVGTRCTIVRLPDDGLWVHSPTSLSDELRDEVKALGDVRHVVAPNVYHHLYAGEWVEAWPDAVLHAPRALAKKREDLKIDREHSDEPDPAWGGAFEPLPIDGCMLRETVFLHGDTKTLITADLFENFETSDHWFTRWYLKASGIHGKPGWSRLMRMVYRDRKAARASLDRIFERDFDRVILSHGEVVDSGGKAVAREAMAWLS